MSPHYDVVVVGAGPAGSVTAALLADAGYRIALLDRAHFPRHKACAEYMSPGVVDALTRLGLAHVLAGAHSLRGMDIIAPSGASACIEYTAGGLPRMACSLPRYCFDARLVEHAASRGVDVLEGYVVQDALVDADVVRGVRGTYARKEHSIKATLTVAADGSRSLLARRLGLARTPRWPVRLGLVAHYEGEPMIRRQYGEMHVSRGGYCGVAPLPDGRVNVAMVLPADAASRSSASATVVFDRWIAAHPRLRDTLSGCRRDTPVRGVGPIGSRTVRSWAPGALLVGDAATFFDPFTGEGIFRALTGAEIAAEIAKHALTCGNVSRTALAIHDRRRYRAFRAKEGVTALVQLFVQYPALIEYALPRLAARQHPREILGTVLGDITDASRFLQPNILWGTLRP